MKFEIGGWTKKTCPRHGSDVTVKRLGSHEFMGFLGAGHWDKIRILRQRNSLGLN